MADPKQLALLKRSVQEWNQWRRAYPGIEVDLSEADFLFADLSGADLSGADLSGAGLLGAGFEGADFRDANLTGMLTTGEFQNLGFRPPPPADLRGADLSFANLRYAYFRGANFRDVNFRGASLRKADVRATILSERNLDGLKRDDHSSKSITSESHANQSSFSPTDWVNFVGTYGNTILTFVASVASVIQGLDVVERRWREYKEKQQSSAQKSSIHKVLDSEITHIHLMMDDGSQHSFEKWVSDPNTLKEYIDAFNDPTSKVKPLEVIFKKHKGRSLSVDVTEGGKDNLQLNVILGYIDSDPQK